MKRFSLLGFVLGIICLISVNTIQASEMELLKPGVVIVTHDPEYPPYEWEENGKSMGFDPAIVKAVIERMGLQVEFKITPWVEALASVKVRKADAISGVEIAEERKRSYDLSEAFAPISSGFFIKADDPDIQSLNDLAGKTIAVSKGGLEINYVREKYPTARIYITDTLPVNFEAILNGKASACAMDRQVGSYIISQKFPGQFKAMGEKFNQTTMGVAVLKGTRAEFLKKFNQALAELKADGTYDRIYNQWLKK
jgi:ABC-type amino acid transport substrate-binding protein